MLHFPILRTKRLTVQLKELSIGDSISIAGMPEHLKEASYTAFINAVIDKIQDGEENSLLWTVQERMLVVAHYLAVVADDAPDFSLGEKAKYSDYLDSMADISKSFNQVQIGEFAGEQWTVSHLVGGMSESIERLTGELPGIPDNMHWMIGSMAAQLNIKGRDAPLVTDGEYDRWLLAQMQVISALPESEFSLIFLAVLGAREKLHHLFKIDFDGSGLIALPKIGGDGELPPAVFPVHSCLSSFAKSMAGRHE